MKKVSYRKLLKDLLALDDTPEKIAISFAVGVYVSVSPFFGIHTIIILSIAFLFKLNKVAALIGSWVNLPWSVPVVFYIEYRIGKFLLNDSTSFELKPFSLQHYLSGSRQAFFDILTGSVIFGGFVSIISYFLIKYLIRTYRRRKLGDTAKG